MPILADAVVDKLRDDEPRYHEMIKSGELEFDQNIVLMGCFYRLYVGVDRYVEALAGCRLVVLLNRNLEVVYSCYFKVAHSPYFGNRVVQTEVRQAPGIRGLARAMMHRYFLATYDAIRTDLGVTRQGRDMWQKFYKEHRREGLCFYHGRIDIDLRKPNGSNNQDAAHTEVVTHLRQIRNACTLEAPHMWHDNREGNVHVIYVSNNPL